MQTAMIARRPDKTYVKIIEGWADSKTCSEHTPACTTQSRADAQGKARATWSEFACKFVLQVQPCVQQLQSI